MPVTPFRRRTDAASLEHPYLVERPLPPGAIDKWEALRTLAVARKSYELSDRELSVLQVLISFHPGNSLDPRNGPVIVYPSNRTICERLNGMPCSTMRRHLSRLVTAGLIIRRDSPNAKRYTRRYGDEKVTFGFDLTPLLTRFPEFCDEARAVRQADNRLKQKRETISLMRRDLNSLIEYGIALAPHRNAWQDGSDLAEEAARALRRKPALTELTALEMRLKETLSEVRRLLGQEHLSTSTAHSEHHHQSQEQEDNLESTPGQTPTRERVAPYRRKPSLSQNDEALQTAGTATNDHANDRAVATRTNSDTPLDACITLQHVLSACPSILELSEFPVHRWHDLVRIADVLVPMLGISARSWDEARSAMGIVEAATVVAVMLERSAEIRSPGGYLRHLTNKACATSFSPGAMLRSLQRYRRAQSSQL